MLLRLACMSILEEVSFTRKDGQYLRWDHRSGRSLRARMDKGPIPSFAAALAKRLDDMATDLEPVAKLFGGGRPTFTAGTCLNRLHRIPAAPWSPRPHTPTATTTPGPMRSIWHS